jgi:zinc D-Ala-D-Ala carboxypeptidase
MHSKYPERLSDNFSFREATFSRTAFKRRIANLPDEMQLQAMYYTAKGMERIRALCDNKIVSVSSWFRSPEVNALIGGAAKSQHVQGEAVDFNIYSFGSPKAICEKIVAFKEIIRFDQLILEPNWVHVSFESDPTKKQRGQVLTITPDGKAHVGLVHYR